MEEKATFLMSNARVLPLEKTGQTYDEALQVNVKTVGGKSVPLAILETASTPSKTAQAPGDDDEDPESQICY